MSLVRSTRARLALLVAAAFLLAFATLGSAVYFAVSALLERDADEVLHAQTGGFVDLHRRLGLQGLVEEVRLRTQEPDDPDDAFAVFARDGIRIAGSELPAPPTTSPQTPGRAQGRYAFVDAASDDHPRVLARFTPLDDGNTLVVALRMRAQDGFRALILRTAFAALLAAAALGAFIGLWASRWMDRRLAHLGETAQRIAEGDLNSRVIGDGSGDAFDHLALRFNGMLDRIAELMAGVRHATDHIAHDLRTPLTRLRHRLEPLRDAATDPALHAAAIDDAIGECDRLLAMFSGLLRLSRIEAQDPDPAAPIVDMGSILVDAADLYAPVAQQRDIALQVQASPASMRGDRDQVFQLVLNLLDNAIKYAPAGSAVALSCTSHGKEVVLDVRDRGIGIAQADRLRVFDRFERLEAHRGTEGSGLGLSLVRAIVLRHGGRIELLDHAPGLIVRVHLPSVVAEHVDAALAQTQPRPA